MPSKETQFKKAPDLPRSSGLRLAEPLRRVVEQIAAAEGATYSDTLRALIAEALAARAGCSPVLDTIQSTLDVLQWQMEKVLDGLAGLESNVG